MRVYFIVFFLCASSLVVAQPVLLIKASDTQVAPANFCFTRGGDDFLPFNQGEPQWQPCRSDKFFWKPYTTEWVYFKVKNTGPEDRSMKFWLNNVQAGITQLYTISDGLLDSSYKTGSLLSRTQRATDDRLLSLPILLKSGVVTEVYIKSYRRHIGITITPLLMDTQHESNHKILDYWLIFGLSFMLIISITGLSIWYYFPSKELGWFSAYSVAVLFYSITVSGLGSLYLWGNLPLFEENAAVFLGSLATATLFQLCRLLFNIKQHYKRTDRFLSVFNILNVTVTLLGFNLLINYISPNAYNILLLLLYLLQIAGYCVIFILSLLAVFAQGRKEFGMISLMFGIILVVVCILILQETAVLPFNYRFHSYMLSFSLFPQTLVPLLFFVNRIKKQLQLRGEEVEKVRMLSEIKLLNERMNLGKELHDDMGSTMSGIKLYSHLATDQLNNDNQHGLKNTLGIIQQTTEELVNRISDQVWLIQNELQNIETLLQRVEEYAGKMAYSKNIKFKAAVSESIREMEASGNYRDLYLFCKEAINNAVKYSEATELLFEVKQDGGNLVFYISDNGKGFDLNAVHNGNGISNMRQRATSMNAELHIESAPGKGTSLTLMIKSLNGV